MVFLKVLFTPIAATESGGDPNAKIYHKIVKWKAKWWPLGNVQVYERCS